MSKIRRWMVAGTLALAACGDPRAATEEAAAPGALPAASTEGAPAAELADVDEGAGEPAAPVAPVTSAPPTTRVEAVGTRVRVVDSAFGRPVPGAAVRFFDLADLEEKDAAKAPTSKLKRRRLWRDASDSRSTDAEGVAQLPAVRAGLYIQAEVDGRSGWAAANVGAASVEIALDVDQPLAVEVVGLDGRPVVGASIWAVSPSDAPFRYSTPRATTDAGGRATIPDLTPIVRYLRSSETDSGVRFEIDAIELENPFEPVTLEQLLQEPVALTLAAHGSVAVDLRAPDGSDPGASHRVEVARAGAHFKAAAIRGDDRRWRVAVVGLGLDLVAESAADRKAFTGPLRDGEVVTVALTSRAPTARLTGRLVAADGSRRSFEAGARVPASMLWFDGRERAHRPLALEVEPDGRFAIAAADDWPASVDWRLLRLIEGATEGHFEDFKAMDLGEPMAFAQVELPADLRTSALASEVIDLGDVALGAAPTVTGGVVTEAGRGVPDIRVALVRVVPNERGASYVDRVSTLTDGEGHFRIRGFEPHDDSDWRFSALIDRGSATFLSLDARLGALDHEIEVPSTARVAIALPEDIDPLVGGSVRVTVRDADGAHLAFWTVSSRAEVEFTITEEGPLDLEFTPAFGFAPLGRVRDVAASFGELTRDPRLLPVDLARDLRELSVSLVDADGRTIESGAVGVLLEGGDGELVRAGSTSRQGTSHSLVVSPLTAGLYASAPGFAEARVEVPIADQLRIELEREPAVRLEVDSAVAAAGWSPELITVGARGRTLPAVDGGFQGPLPVPGEYRLNWVRVNEGVWERVESAVAVDVADSDQLQTFGVEGPTE